MRAKAMATSLAAMAALIVLAPAAGAAPKTVHRPADTTVELSGKGTHGFGFIMFSFGRSVILSTSKPLNGLGLQNVAYVAFRRDPLAGIDQGRLDIKVGKLGHFRGHFVATSTKVQKLENGCQGEPTKVEEGYFAGSFVFRGERGYTTIHAPRESGSITRSGATDCRIPAGEPGSHGHNGWRVEEKAAEEDEVRLLAGDSKANLVLQASRGQVPPGSGNPATTTFEVSMTGGRAGAFQVSHSAFLFDTNKDAASTFLTPNPTEPLAEATLEPPAPFSGSATFHLEGPKTASWTGDLAVELPGLGKLPLTGKKFYAGVCKGRSNCTATLPGLLGELIEAGDGGLITVGLGTGKSGS